jgi:hypothetical protein
MECSVVIVEPSLRNLARVGKTLQRLVNTTGSTVPYYLYRNAAANQRGPLRLSESSDNHGAAEVALRFGDDRDGPPAPTQPDAVDAVQGILLDDLFHGRGGPEPHPKAPRHPRTGEPAAPWHVQFMVVDLTGLETAAMAGAMRLLQEGRVPYVMANFYPSQAEPLSECNPVDVSLCCVIRRTIVDFSWFCSS